MDPMRGNMYMEEISMEATDGLEMALVLVTDPLTHGDLQFIADTPTPVEWLPMGGNNHSTWAPHWRRQEWDLQPAVV
ncbi:hypothetical protein XELAEV_18003119mg [Xenopus laevis]|uniref:Uncharacterized protein n=1 Tax=Xenopus laevis TaxID=8355 RepID=A0A974BPU2_XENLA|nr:hypothetical protein XELAEV_18003119mg [Xenopus laevis]